MLKISVEELRLFHKVDRWMFSRLVKEMHRDPAESLLMMAVWLWLQEEGYPNIIVKLVKVSDMLVYPAVEEALVLLKSLEAGAPHALLTAGTPFTDGIIKMTIPLQKFNHDRVKAICGIKNVLQNVCSRVFTDILLTVFFGTPNMFLDRPFVVPGFPHPLFGSVAIATHPMDYDIPSNIWEYKKEGSNVGAEWRTLFLTFSRGFPVSEDEVLKVFTELFGNKCVERIEMGNASSTEQTLFAKLILDSTASIGRILDGKRVQKFRINGKHIWARWYEVRD